MIRRTAVAAGNHQGDEKPHALAKQEKGVR